MFAPALLRHARTPAAAHVRALSGPASSGRLEELRDRLAQEDADLVTFTEAAPAKRTKGKKQRVPKPKWLKAPAPGGEQYLRLKDTVRRLGLATVCEEAQCPNIGECWNGETATATIMLMGDTCTRGCSFCAIKTSRAPPPVNPDEPRNVAEAIAAWGLDYVVLTSVDRDDMEDLGSEHFASTVRHLKAEAPQVLVECLTPDFNAVRPLVDNVARSGLDVFAHNIETVERLQRRVRDHRAGYRQSIRVLEMAKEAQPSLITKTSVMLGVGEEPDEVRQSMRDLRDAGVDVVTFGQYLRPSKKHMPIRSWVTPEQFEEWQAEGEAMGFKYVASGALVRSSYKAGEFFLKGMVEERRAAGLA